ncbi:hypothetical protein CTheo_2974 [Ceratobasidium theobromae]|uniref:Transmembrane protein n=1 Tax=Ceratobasidium theobromae TaxID=1582974 RepID=A0A5N5QP83_9AGAM|nr:hypothetical protein CTheo_2974 [Ceratobasidium theobromae]
MHALCSLFLLVIILLPALLLRFRLCISFKRLWTCDTKDISLGTLVPNDDSCTLSVMGTRHAYASPHSARQAISIPAHAVKRFFAKLFFRRVNPVETKPYVFTRNMFAVIAISLIIFRTIVGLLQARDTYEPRIRSSDCNYDSLDGSKLQILMTSSTGSEIPIDTLIEVSVEMDTGLEPCSHNSLVAYDGIYLRKPTNGESRGRLFPYRFNAFSCNSSNVRPTYYIKIWSPDGGALDANYDIPSIWFSNIDENFGDRVKCQGLSKVSPMSSPVPLYIPGWKPHPGSHMEADVRLITRRFITSSSLQDLILNQEPRYTNLSLYPITTSVTSALPNNTSPSPAAVATVLLRTSLEFRFTYLRDQDSYRDMQKQMGAGIQTCDFIKDVRSTNVLDVLSSVGDRYYGGLLVRKFLDPRVELFTKSPSKGAKLITPFGLTGALSSKRFKRRLQERYHRQPTEDNPDIIHVSMLLRDFVVDFRPANVDLDCSLSAHTPTSLTNKGDNATSNPILMISGQIAIGLRVLKSTQSINVCFDPLMSPMTGVTSTLSEAVSNLRIHELTFAPEESTIQR